MLAAIISRPICAAQFLYWLPTDLVLSALPRILVAHAIGIFAFRNGIALGRALTFAPPTGTATEPSHLHIEDCEPSCISPCEHLSHET